MGNHHAIAAGMTWMARNGFFLGAAAKWNFPMRDRSTGIRVADYTDIQVRLGWRPGVRSGSAMAKAAPQPIAPAIDTTAADREAAERAAAAEREAAGRAAPERAAAEKAPAPSAAAPAPAGREFVFEDVYFDFDRYSLRPEALRVLGEAVRSMNEAKSVRLVIEGHTCNIGTTVQLGARRTPRPCRLRLPHLAWRRSVASELRDIRGGTSEVRQHARGNAAVESSRRHGGASGDDGYRPALSNLAG